MPNLRLRPTLAVAIAPSGLCTAPALAAVSDGTSNTIMVGAVKRDPGHQRGCTAACLIEEDGTYPPFT
jgi:hypothetical protein